MAMSPAAHTTGQAQIYQNFIAGEWRGSPSGKTFTSTNPANTNEIVGHFQQSTLADLEEAVAAARKAQPAWAAVPMPERGEILLRTALLLEQHKEEFAALMGEENSPIHKSFFEKAKEFFK